MSRRVILFFAASLGLLGGHCAQAQTPQLNSGDPAIRITKTLPCPDCLEGPRQPSTLGGRYAKSGQRQWPGSYWEADVSGASFMVHLSGDDNIFGIYADGKKIDTESTRGEVITYAGLSDGPHHIRVETQTELQASAYIGVHEIMVPDGATVLPAPPTRARQIEFIGDFFTVGYGNTSGKRQCTRDEVRVTTDTSQAFGPLTARHFDADYQINAISGRGIVRNYNGFSAPHMPEAYPFALLDGRTPLEATGWEPQIMVVWLGTNDFSTPLNPGEKWQTRTDLQADYEDTYVKFVQGLRARNPNAYLILTAQGPADDELPTEVRKVIKRLTTAGERHIAFLSAPSLHLGGCDGHPDTGDDRAIADGLIAFIDAKPDIWK